MGSVTSLRHSSIRKLLLVSQLPTAVSSPYQLNARMAITVRRSAHPPRPSTKLNFSMAVVQHEALCQRYSRRRKTLHPGAWALVSIHTHRPTREAPQSSAGELALCDLRQYSVFSSSRRTPTLTVFERDARQWHPFVAAVGARARLAFRGKSQECAEDRPRNSVGNAEAGRAHCGCSGCFV